METVKSRSESPFSVDKANTQSLENPENKIEQIKQKKKSKRNKQKTEVNGNENADSAKNGKDFYKEEVFNPHQIENNGNDNDNDNGIDIQNDIDKGSSDMIEVNDSSNSMPELVKEQPFNMPEAADKLQEEINAEESTNSEEQINQAVVENENHFENGNNCNSTFLNETDVCAKNDISQTENSAPGNVEGINNGMEESSHEEVNGVSVSSTQDQGIVEGNSFMDDTPENSINDSNNESWSKEVDSTRDADQPDPETPAKEEISFSNKISSFLGKWNSSLSPEQKQDSEISSLKKLNDSLTSKGSVLSHPYLSKVSGRPGIRGGHTSSTLSLDPDFKNDEIKTPKSSEIALDDSFRVRTDPSRMNSSTSEFQENPPLRKFKGKRCLNASDDPADGDDVFSSTTKKRKIEDKTTDSGFLGNILWSPFRKKSLDGEESRKLTTTESKLSRFLSPFWFWKKTATCQKGQ